MQAADAPYHTHIWPALTGGGVGVHSRLSSRAAATALTMSPLGRFASLETRLRESSIFYMTSRYPVYKKNMTKRKNYDEKRLVTYIIVKDWSDLFDS